MLGTELVIEIKRMMCFWTTGAKMKEMQQSMINKNGNNAHIFICQSTSSYPEECRLLVGYEFRGYEQYRMAPGFARIKSDSQQ